MGTIFTPLLPPGKTKGAKYNSDIGGRQVADAEEEDGNCAPRDQRKACDALKNITKSRPRMGGVGQMKVRMDRMVRENNDPNAQVYNAFACIPKVAPLPCTMK